MLKSERSATKEPRSRDNMACVIRVRLPTKFPYTVLQYSAFLGKLYTVCRHEPCNRAQRAEDICYWGRDSIAPSFITMLDRCVLMN